MEIKYLFPTSFSGTNFYIYELHEGLRTRKTLAHSIRMQKNPKTKEEIFWISTDLWSYAGPKSNLHTLHRNFINVITNSEIVY